MNTPQHLLTDYCLACGEVTHNADVPLCRLCVRKCDADFDHVIRDAARVRHLARLGPPQRRPGDVATLETAVTLLENQLALLLDQATDYEREIERLRTENQILRMNATGAAIGNGF